MAFLVGFAFESLGFRRYFVWMNRRTNGLTGGWPAASELPAPFSNRGLKMLDFEIISSSDSDS